MSHSDFCAIAIFSLFSLGCEHAVEPDGQAQAGRQEDNQADEDAAGEAGMAQFEAALGWVGWVVINKYLGVERVGGEGGLGFFFVKDIGE